MNNISNNLPPETQNKINNIQSTKFDVYNNLDTIKDQNDDVPKLTQDILEDKNIYNNKNKVPSSEDGNTDVESNISQTGGGYKCLHGKQMNICKNCSKYIQRGGNESKLEEKDFLVEMGKYSTVTKWLPFFKNIENWSDESKYNFNQIRINYFMILIVLNKFQKLFGNLVKETNPFTDFDSTIEDILNLFEMLDYNSERIFKDFYDSNNNSEDT